MDPSRFLPALGGLISVGLATLPIPADAASLYTLSTTCSLKGAASVPCTVDVGEATEHRHKVGETL